MNRRRFGQLMLAGGAAVIAGPMVVFETACTFGSVVAKIMQYVPVGLQAFSSVVAILTAEGILGPLGPTIQAAISLVKVGFADLQAAIAAYNAAPAANKQTLLGKISTIISVIQGEIQQFWNDLNLPQGTLAATIQGLLGVLLSTLAAFASQLPAPAVSAKVLPKMIAVPAKMRSPKQVRQDFDKILVGTKWADQQI